MIYDAHCHLDLMDNMLEFINEIQQYHWQEDKDGNVIEKPVKKFDHLM